MRHLPIATDGRLTDCDTPNWDHALGPHGPARVSLHARYAAAGWVSDRGHDYPDQYPRNEVGGCFLAALGSAPLPYAGPVVITGRDSSHSDCEVVGLPDSYAAVLTSLHTDVVAALAGQPVTGQSEDWACCIRRFGAHTRWAPAPELTARHLHTEVAAR